MARFKINRVDALTAAINAYAANEQHDPEVLAVLDNMLYQLSKPSAKKEGESEARKLNRELLHQVLMAWPEDLAALTCHNVVEACGNKVAWPVSIDGRVSSQRVSKVLMLGVELGKLTVCKIGRLNAYTKTLG